MSASTQTTKPLNKLARFIPILAWLPHYDRSWLSMDVIAGLTLWGLVVPEAMAYAGIAGLPPQAGLYTLLAALLVYALLGTSRHLVVQATSATAALLASSVAAALVATAAANASDPATYQAYASAFVLVTGLVFLAAGLARLGFITQFLSKPVMSGFVMGLAIFVVVGQLNKLFGVPKPEGNTVEKLIRHRQGVAPGQLGYLCRGRRGAGAALLAAPLEQEAAGRPGGALRGDHPQQGARFRGELRHRSGGGAAARTAVAGLAASAVDDLPGDGAAGHGRAAGGLQRGAGRGPRVRRKTWL